MCDCSGRLAEDAAYMSMSRMGMLLPRNRAMPAAAILVLNWCGLRACNTRTGLSRCREEHCHVYQRHSKMVACVCRSPACWRDCGAEHALGEHLTICIRCHQHSGRVHDLSAVSAKVLWFVVIAVILPGGSCADSWRATPGSLSSGRTSMARAMVLPAISSKRCRSCAYTLGCRAWPNACTVALVV